MTQALCPDYYEKPNPTVKSDRSAVVKLQIAATGK